MMLPRPHRVPVLLALLLLDAAGAAFAWAESPLTDPVAPAVVGRPLDQIRPSRPARPAVRKPAAGPNKGVRAQRPATPQASPRPAAFQGAPVRPPVLDDDAPRPQRQAKKTLDDRTDPRVRSDDVGRGTHFARKPLGTGVYFDDKIRAAVRKYFEAHPAAGTPPQWQVGEALPAGVPVGKVPPPVLASLPRLPPGHQYLDVGGDILLVAARSKMVVDGISAR